MSVCNAEERGDFWKDKEDGDEVEDSGDAGCGDGEDHGSGDFEVWLLDSVPVRLLARTSIYLICSSFRELTPHTWTQPIHTFSLTSITPKW